MQGSPVRVLVQGAAALALLLGCAGNPVVGPVKCAAEQECRDYLVSIQRSVYRKWEPGKKAPSGVVKLRFTVDPEGNVPALSAVPADASELALSCERAFRAAAPFGAPPAELVGKKLILTFDLHE